MNLWEINDKIEKCFVYEDGVVDVETGEIFDADYLDNLELEKDVKIENICKYIKNLESDAKALKEQKDKFSKMQKSAENKKENLKEYLANFLSGETWKARDLSVSVKYRKSESVNVIDEEQIPMNFKIEQPAKVDKTLIKKSIKNGEEVAGAELVVKNNMQVV